MFELRRTRCGTNPTSPDATMLGGRSFNAMGRLFHAGVVGGVCSKWRG